jgi:hypothetical protein
MPAPPPDAADTNLSDPHQDRPAPGADPSTPTGCLIGLVRKLIDYGRHLAETLRRQTTGAEILNAKRDFGTLDIRQIIASITRGLHRASELETRLARRAAREAIAPAATAAPSARAPRAASPAQRTAEAADPRLARMPTPAEIAAQIRLRPIGVIIADICRDLGIMPSSKLWHEIANAVVEYGGNLAKLFSDVCNRFRPWPIEAAVAQDPAQTARSCGAPIVPGTGPP